MEALKMAKKAVNVLKEVKIIGYIIQVNLNKDLKLEESAEISKENIADTLDIHDKIQEEEKTYYLILCTSISDYIFSRRFL